MNSNFVPVTEATLVAFSAAWNQHDIDALMSFMSDDCIFESSAGPHACGTRHVGKDAVRQAFASAWQITPDAQWRQGQHFVQGDFGISQWTFTGTTADGSRIETDGVDIFTGTTADGSRIETDGVDIFKFKNDKIQSKKVFRKVRPNLPAVT